MDTLNRTCRKLAKTMEANGFSFVERMEIWRAIIMGSSQCSMDTLNRTCRKLAETMESENLGFDLRMEIWRAMVKIDFRVLTCEVVSDFLEVHATEVVQWSHTRPADLLTLGEKE